MSVETPGPVQGEAEEPEVPSDIRMMGTLWPALLASALGLVPFTVFSTFLVPIAEESSTSVALMGGLRGLGGLAALLVGAALAPLIDRLPKNAVAAGALVLLAVSSVLGAVGELVALGAFCLLTGAATAMLNPALSTAAADRYGSGPAAGRAATLLTATQSLTAMLAAPVISLPALLWGWRGDLVAVAVACVLLAGVVFAWGSKAESRASDADRLGYLASFRALAAVPGAVPLLLIAFLRTASFMGYLSYLAAFYDQRFALKPEVFALVWTLSGASFFVGNLLIGRVINSGSARISAERAMSVGLIAAVIAMFGFYTATALPMALLWTSVLGLSHATVAACVVTLLVRRCAQLRGSALSINAAGMSLGVFVGAAVGGVGLGLAGYLGTAIAFGGLSLVAVFASLAVSVRA